MDLSWCIRNLFTAIGNSWSGAHSSSSNYSPQLLRVRLLTVNLKFNDLHHVHRIILSFFAFSFERFFPFCQLNVFLSPFRVFSPTDFKIARFDVFGLHSKNDLIHHWKPKKVCLDYLTRLFDLLFGSRKAYFLKKNVLFSFLIKVSAA